MQIFARKYNFEKFACQPVHSSGEIDILIYDNIMLYVLKYIGLCTTTVRSEN